MSTIIRKLFFLSIRMILCMFLIFFGLKLWISAFQFRSKSNAAMYIDTNKSSLDDATDITEWKKVLHSLTLE